MWHALDRSPSSPVVLLRVEFIVRKVKESLTAAISVEGGLRRAVRANAQAGCSFESNSAVSVATAPK